MIIAPVIAAQRKRRASCAVIMRKFFKPLAQLRDS
jgi:hypothetical protein